MLDLFKRKAPADPPPAEAPERKSWTERLKAGLGRSREKLAGALTGVFVRRTLDEGASYQRQLRVAEAHGGELTAVVAHLARELREGTVLPGVE